MTSAVVDRPSPGAGAAPGGLRLRDIGDDLDDDFELVVVPQLKRRIGDRRCTFAASCCRLAFAMAARVHPQSSGRALAASAAGSSKSGRMGNLLKRQLTQREFELELEHRRLDLFEYLVSFNAEQAAKRDDGDVAPSRIEESSGARTTT